MASIIRYFLALILSSFVFAQEAKIEDVVILGSGPAGATAAIYTARAGLSTLLIEGQEPGGQIAYSYEVENFPGFPTGINGFELAEKMKEQALKFSARLQTGVATKVELNQSPFTITLENGEKIQTKTLIVASGASANLLGLSAEKALLGKGVSTCAVCDGFFYKGKRVLVVGGGDAALEDALYIAKIAEHVTVAYRGETLRASPYLQKKVKQVKNIEMLSNTILVDITDPGKGAVEKVFLRNTKTQTDIEKPVDGVFIAIGHKPNSELFKDVLDLDAAGYIITEPHSSKTSKPGVFAAGDVVDAVYRQAVTAAAAGAMAGIDVYQYVQKKFSEEQ